jgi:hypothetical protein
MNGFFERLAQRARGGAAIAGLPLVRPLPALYQGARREMATEDSSIEIEIETAAPRRATRQDPSQPGRPTQAAAPKAAAQATTKRVKGPSGVPPPDAWAPLVGEEAPAPPATRRSTAPPPVQEATDVSTGRREEDGLAPPEQNRQSRSTAPPAPPPAHPSIATSIEQVFAAIEAPPSADFTPARWEDRSPSRRDEAPPPVVSIGRIDIVVAPPPVPAAPVERTRGFQNYARLRRGLAR